MAHWWSGEGIADSELVQTIYHGAVAPLHLLPKIVPCLLSLHNAEFQGLWPMRSELESQEICEIYNLSPAVRHAPPRSYPANMFA